MTRRDLHAEAGSSTIMSLALIAVLLTVTVAALAVLSVVRAAHIARSAADLSALAGAIEYQASLDASAACAESDRLAQRHDVRLLDCRVTGDLHDATVYYTVRGRDINDEPDYDQPSIFRPAPPPPPAPVGPPVLGYDQFAALTATLMRNLETPELQRYHQACQPVPAEQQPDPAAAELESRLNEAGHEAGRRLAEIPERHPIAAAADWREALYYTWLNRRKQLLAVALREAFAKYETPRERPHPF